MLVQDPHQYWRCSRYYSIKPDTSDIDSVRNFQDREELQNANKALRCDPWDQITYLRERASEKQEKYYKSQESIEPLFEQGRYQDHSNDRHFSTETSPVFQLECLTESVGFPLRWNHMAFLSGVAQQLAVSEAVGSELRSYVLAIRAADGDSAPAVKQVFSRIALANTPSVVVDSLIERMLRAIAYWRKQASAGIDQQKSHAINAIRVVMEVLARLAIRQSPEESKRMFHLAMEIGRDSPLRHHWLMEVLDHLAKYSLNSIPDTQQSDLLFDALSFPLPCEIGITGIYEAERWPNPVIEASCNRESNPRLDARIHELIEFAVVGSASCASTLLRLLPLIENGTLTKVELDGLAIKLWGAKPDYKTLPSSGLFTHALLTLPAIDRDKANELISTLLFDVEDALFFSTEHLTGLIGAAASKPAPLFPNSEQAVKCFDRLVVWRPSKEADDLFGTVSRKREALIEDIGEALAYSITPSLAPGDITVQRFEKVQAFYMDVGSSPTVLALPYFAGLNSDIADIVGTAIRKGIQGRTPDEVRWSVYALNKWKELAVARKVPAPPDSLFSRVIYLIEAGRTVGLHSLLWYAGEMLRKNWLSTADVDALADCVPDLFNANDYRDIRPSSREAVTVSLIREACVKLAIDVMSVAPSEKLTAVIEAAKDDALPEVRFAGNRAD